MVIHSGETSNSIAGPAHLLEHSVEPLQRAIKMEFNPAGSSRDGLPSILGTPALHERQTNFTHVGQCVHLLIAMRNGSRQQLGEFNVIEDLQIATWEHKKIKNQVVLGSV